MEKVIKKPNRNYVEIGVCEGYAVKLAEPRSEDHPNYQRLNFRYRGRRCKQRKKISFWPEWCVTERRFKRTKEARWLFDQSEADYNALAEFMERYFDAKRA